MLEIHLVQTISDFVIHKWRATISEEDPYLQYDPAKALQRAEFMLIECRTRG